ncbi:hypothetical protein L7F22_068325 [Adiantum nelumboides]|nr:hypothetical protein [Adiantum nelumboides]
MLPRFFIEEKTYMLLTDVQTLFNLREDYALGMLARYLNKQHGFVEEDSSDDKRLETNPNAMKCLRYYFEEARKYKESGLPKNQHSKVFKKK